MISQERQKIKYSIIIPAYNVGMYIIECVESILRRTQDDYEIIIINDGSIDDTARTLASFNNQKVLVITQENRGVSSARNRGLEIARGEYSIFLDGDDRINPLLFDRLACHMDMNPKVDLVYGNYKRIKENGSPIAGDYGKIRFRPSGSVLRPMLRGNFIASPGMALVRTITAHKLGGFDSSLIMSEDWNFWCRLAAQGLFVYRRDLCILEYRQRISSSTRTIAFELRHHTRAFEATFSSPEIIKMLKPKELLYLKRQQEGHIHSFISCQRMRAGERLLGWKELLTAISFSPERSLEFVIRTLVSLALNRK